MSTICQMIFQPLATDVIHLTPESRKLQMSWDKMDKEIVKKALWICWERRRVRLREIAKLNKLNEVKALKMTGMKRQVRSR